VVTAKGEKRGPDGMYENHLVVMASSDTAVTSSSREGSRHGAQHELGTSSHRRAPTTVLLDATRGVLVLSSTIILLPFRLVSLALGLFSRHENGFDQLHKNQLQSSLAMKRSSRTNDVLWLSESPIADLSNSLLLLLLNNERAGDNTFRVQVATLTDNRWDSTNGTNEGLPDLPFAQHSRQQSSEEEMSPLVVSNNEFSTTPPISSTLRKESDDVLQVNFERIFASFGATAHTEVGALLLYTILQVSPLFAAAMAARSDLDTVVLPLLRTLYFSSASRRFVSQDYSVQASSSRLSLRTCPFRFQSHAPPGATLGNGVQC